VPIFDYARANEELASQDTDHYYECCGKTICVGCIHSFVQSDNIEKCPFCKSERRVISKTDDEKIEETMKRVDVNDVSAICMLAAYHYCGFGSLQQDEGRAMELWKQAAKLGSSDAHHHMGNVYYEGGDLKKAKFHFGAAAVAGNEEARSKLGDIEGSSGNVERAVKHWTIAASAGHFNSMNHLRKGFEQGVISRDAIDSTLAAYNSSCKEMRSEARDAFIRTLAGVCQDE
jgi:TPR repeat protein